MQRVQLLLQIWLAGKPNIVALIFNNSHIASKPSSPRSCCHFIYDVMNLCSVV